MRGRSALITAAFSLLILAGGCDSFSLTDQFDKSLASADPAPTNPTPTDPGTTPTDPIPTDPIPVVDPLVLELSSTELLRQETADLNPSGGTPPYKNYHRFEVDLPYKDLSDPLGTIDASGSQHTFTAGKSIGKVKLRVVDSAGKTAETFVTIIPPAVASLAVAPAGMYTLKLTWPAYADTALISGIRISILKSGTYTEVATVEKTKTEFTHSDTSILKKNTTYTYRLEAVNGLNGIYASKPTEGTGKTDA